MTNSLGWKICFVADGVHGSNTGVEGIASALEFSFAMLDGKSQHQSPCLVAKLTA